MSLSLYFLDLSVCAGILSSFYYVIYHNQTLELKIKTQNNAINRHDSYKYTERLISNSMNFLENEIDDDEM